MAQGAPPNFGEVVISIIALSFCFFLAMLMIRAYDQMYATWCSWKINDVVNQWASKLKKAIQKQCPFTWEEFIILQFILSVWYCCLLIVFADLKASLQQ